MIQKYDHPYVFLPDKDRLENTRRIKKNAAVFINLYYEEQIDYYKNYLDEIPDYIDIYVISSKECVLEKFGDNRYKTIKKENRGRDISALLIAAGPFILQYDYVCFCHDKRELVPEDKTYTDEWKLNLFQNTIGTGIYIENLLSFMERNAEVGMCVPLPQHGYGRLHYLKGDWGLDYELTLGLINELGIKAELSPERLPFTFGTVFWAKSKAIQKLYTKSWKYEDFPEEPLAFDGEINHAIERIMQYLVEDAGYIVKMTVSVSYAERFMNFLRRDLSSLWDVICDKYVYYHINQIQEKFEKEKLYKTVIRDYCEKYDRIYLYGAGKVADSCMKYLSEAGIFPTGILVTESDGSKYKNRVPITTIDKFDSGSGAGVIVTVGEKLLSEVLQILEQYEIKDYLVFAYIAK